MRKNSRDEKLQNKHGFQEEEKDQMWGKSDEFFGFNPF